MPENWKTYKLGEVATLRKKTVRPKDFNGEKYIGLEHIGQGDFLLNGIGIASDVTSNKFKFKSEDILYGKIRPYFRKVYKPRFSGICSTDILIIKSSSEEVVTQEYLYQLIKTQTFTDKAVETSSGTKMPRADWYSLEQVEFIFPPLQEQKSIASILSALDDKIELNLQMNKTLEEMAMALYKHWFVDFGPFQDGEFVTSELGEIPKGWEVKGILELTDLLSGGTPKTKIAEYWDGTVNWVSAKDIGNGGNIYISDTEKKITEKGVENSSTKILPSDTVILVARGSVGKFGMIAKPMAMNQSCYGLFSKGEFSQGLVYLMCSNLIEQFKRVSYGSVFDTITTSTFKATKVVSPPSAVIKELKGLIDPLFIELKNNIFENQTLTQLRDTLLPKLISGEVHVKEVEKTLSEVL